MFPVLELWPNSSLPERPKSAEEGHSQAPGLIASSLERPTEKVQDALISIVRRIPFHQAKTVAAIGQASGLAEFVSRRLKSLLPLQSAPWAAS